jgi:predicted enzyme related to lactoylglutathione lyase
MSGLFRKIDCHGLPVDDLDKALDFYETKLGHELIWRSDSIAGLRLPESNAELVLHTKDRPIETDFTVGSVPEAIKTFTEAGGEVVVDPFDIAIGKCAVLRDPWGNKIVILDNSKGLLQVDRDKNVIK